MVNHVVGSQPPWPAAGVGQAVASVATMMSNRQGSGEGRGESTAGSADRVGNSDKRRETVAAGCGCDERSFAALTTGWLAGLPNRVRWAEAAVVLLRLPVGGTPGVS